MPEIVRHESKTTSVLGRVSTTEEQPGAASQRTSTTGPTSSESTETQQEYQQTNTSTDTSTRTSESASTNAGSTQTDNRPLHRGITFRFTAHLHNKEPVNPAPAAP